MIKQGTNVEWKWGGGKAQGEVQEVFHDSVTRTIDGNEVTRDGTKDCPAYLIKQSDGGKVLKLQSEVSRVSSQGEPNFSPQTSLEREIEGSFFAACDRSISSQDHQRVTYALFFVAK